MPQANEEVGLVLVVKLAEQRADGLGRLVGVVKGNAREQVVNAVSSDDAVEEVLVNPSKVAVDGAEVAEGKVPGAFGVVRHIGVGVVQVGNGNEPVVHPEVRLSVQEADHLPADLLRGKVQDVAHDGQSEVRQDDEDGLARDEENAPRVKVAAALVEPARLVVVANTALLSGRNVEKQVRLPAKELVEQQLRGIDDRSVLGEFVQSVDRDLELRGHVLLRLGDEDEVLFNVAGEAVVARVRKLPGKVGHQQEGVTEPANRVVEHTVLGKGSVAAFVGEDPNTRKDESLGEAVENPSGSANPEGFNSWNLQACPSQDGNENDVPRHIAHGNGHRGLKTMRRDGLLDVAEGRALGDISR